MIEGQNSKKKYESCSNYENCPPQINIYNRYFYLRQQEHNLLQQQHQRELKQLANKPKITLSSYQILCGQLQKNMLSIFKEFDKSSAHQLQNQMINFSNFQNLIYRLTGIKQSQGGLEMEHFQSQLWLMLGNYQLIPQLKGNIVYAVFRILLDPYNLSEKQCENLLNQIQVIKESPKGRSAFLQQYPTLKDQTLTLNQTLKLWKLIRYKNPHFSTLTQRKQNFQQPTFQPQVNEKSRILAKNARQKFLSNHQSMVSPQQFTSKLQHNQLEKYFSENMNTVQKKKIPYFEILHKRKLQKDMLPPMNLKKIEEEQKILSKTDRTAPPSEIKQIVNNLYVKKQRRQDTDFKKVDEQAQLKQCTFTPRINEYYGPRRSVSPIVRNYEKNVQRLHKGRKQKEEKKEALQNLGRVKNPRKYERQPKQSKVPSFIERDAPKLILQIRIDDNRTQKLSLKGSEDSHFVAKKFVSKHGLQDSMIQVLEQLIDEQLDNL